MGWMLMQKLDIAAYVIVIIPTSEGAFKALNSLGLGLKNYAWSPLEDTIFRCDKVDWNLEGGGAFWLLHSVCRICFFR